MLNYRWPVYGPAVSQLVFHVTPNASGSSWCIRLRARQRALPSLSFGEGML